MHLHEVVNRGEDCDRRLVVGELAAEGVRQPDELSAAHPHVQVQPFDVRGADPVRVRKLSDGALLGAYYPRGAVPPLTFHVLAVLLDELRVVDPVAEVLVHRVEEGASPVRSSMETTRSVLFLGRRPVSCVRTSFDCDSVRVAPHYPRGADNETEPARIWEENP